MRDKGETYRSVWRHLMTVPFRQDYVEAAGIRTRYVQAGNPDAPVVLMLHGTGGHWEAYCANIGPFSEHFNVYAIDLVGSGFSDKPDRPYEIADYVEQIIGFMDAMGIARATLIGVSIGSWMSARVAQAYPDRVDGLILLGTPGLLPAPPGFAAALSARRDTANDQSWEAICRALSPLYHDQANLIDDIVAVRQQVYSIPGIEKIMPRMLTLMDPEVRNRNNLTEDEWRSIKAPTLIVLHVEMPDTYLEAGRKLAKIMTNVEVLEMRRAAHWGQFEDPDTFNAAAIAFLLRHARGGEGQAQKQGALSAV